MSQSNIKMDMCEFVEHLTHNHFVIEQDFVSKAYYLELEGSIQSTREECERFLISHFANGNAVNRLFQFKNEIVKLKKETDLRYMNPDDIISAIVKIINERDDLVKKYIEGSQKNQEVKGN